MLLRVAERFFVLEGTQSIVNARYVDEVYKR
jgi:hypothetical protein